MKHNEISSFETLHDGGTSHKRPMWAGIPTTPNSFLPLFMLTGRQKSFSNSEDMPDERNIFSLFPHNSMMTTELPKEVIFSANVFTTRREKDVMHQHKSEYLISIAYTDHPHKLLLIDSSDPLNACLILTELSSYKPTQPANDFKRYKSRTCDQNSNARRKFKKCSVEIMLERKIEWLNYWKAKFNVHHEYGKLTACGPFSLEEVQDHFLLGIFYVNMITSIVVDKHDPEWREHQVNNSRIIKMFAVGFQEKMKDLIIHDIKQTGPNSVESLKTHNFRINWLLIRRFPEIEKRYNLIYTMLDAIHPRIDFFDDVFAYSIPSLNQIVTNFYQKNAIH
jgi:hypothetical protein